MHGGEKKNDNGLSFAMTVFIFFMYCIRRLISDVEVMNIFIYFFSKEGEVSSS